MKALKKNIPSIKGKWKKFFYYICLSPYCWYNLFEIKHVGVCRTTSKSQHFSPASIVKVDGSTSIISISVNYVADDDFSADSDSFWNFSLSLNNDYLLNLWSINT